MYPTSYRAVTVPIREVCDGPSRFNVLRKSGVTMTPPDGSLELVLRLGVCAPNRRNAAIPGDIQVPATMMRGKERCHAPKTP